MGLFGSSERAFVKDNAVRADQRPLLATGAILIYANSWAGWTTQTLKLDQRKVTAARVLDEFWDITERSQALSEIEDLLAGGSSTVTGGNLSRAPFQSSVSKYNTDSGWHGERRDSIDARLARYTSGDRSALSPAEAAMLDKVVDNIIANWYGNMAVTRISADWVKTVLAYDVDRAAFVARLAFNCGYLTEDETWNTLRRTRSMAEATFSRWFQYGLSFMKGRAIAMCDTDFSDMKDLCNKILLLDAPRWGDVWASSPLHP